MTDTTTLSNDKRHRKSEKEEDAELLQNEVDEDVYVYDESPPCESSIQILGIAADQVIAFLQSSRAAR